MPGRRDSVDHFKSPGPESLSRTKRPLRFTSPVSLLPIHLQRMPPRGSLQWCTGAWFQIPPVGTSVPCEPRWYPPVVAAATYSSTAADSCEATSQLLRQPRLGGVPTPTRGWSRRGADPLQARHVTRLRHAATYSAWPPVPAKLSASLHRRRTAPRSRQGSRRHQVSLFLGHDTTPPLS